MPSVKVGNKTVNLSQAEFDKLIDDAGEITISKSEEVVTEKVDTTKGIIRADLNETSEKGGVFESWTDDLSANNSRLYGIKDMRQTSFKRLNPNNRI